MLKRQFRLTKKVLGKSKSVQSRFFFIKIADNDLSYNRFAFVVSKKIDKRAVVRNRARRKVRACIEQMFDNIQTGHDMVFVLRKDAVEAKQAEIANEIKILFEKELLLQNL